MNFKKGAPETHRSRARHFHHQPTKPAKPNFCHITAIFSVLIFFIYLNFQYLIEPGIEDELGKKNNCKSAIEFEFPNASDANLMSELLDAFTQGTTSGNVILSVDRNKQDKVIVVIPYIDGHDNSRKLIKTLKSISKNSDNEDKLENGVFVIFGKTFDDITLIRIILKEFFYDIKVGFLKLVKIHHTILTENDLIKTPNRTENVEFSSKTGHPLFESLKLILQVQKYLSQNSENLLIIDANVEILIARFLRNIDKYIKKLTKSWSVIEFSDHLSATFTGKLIRSKELFKFIYFHMHYFSQRIFAQITEDKLLETFSNYLHLMYQSNFIVSRPSLLVNRKHWGDGEEGDEKDDLLGKLFKDRWRSDDPTGNIITNMESVDSKHTPIKMYGSLSGYYFHAKNVEPGDWIVLAFEDDGIHLSKVIVETGLADANSKQGVIFNSEIHKDNSNSTGFWYEIKGSLYELVEAILETSPKILRMEVDKNEIRCADFRHLGTVKGSRTVMDGLDKKPWSAPTKCLKLTITKVIKPISDVVIRQLAIYTG